MQSDVYDYALGSSQRNVNNLPIVSILDSPLSVLGSLFPVLNLCRRLHLKS